MFVRDCQVYVALLCSQVRFFPNHHVYAADLCKLPSALKMRAMLDTLILDLRLVLEQHRCPIKSDPAC